MMIKCSSCNKIMLKANFVVISTREAIYVNNLFKKKNRKSKINSIKIIHKSLAPEFLEKMKLEGWIFVKTWQTKGQEIVSIKNLCKECEKNDKH